MIAPDAGAGKGLLGPDVAFDVARYGGTVNP